MPEKVALIGSGNWGSAIATKIGLNVLQKTDLFDASAPPRRPPAWQHLRPSPHTHGAPR